MIWHSLPVISICIIGALSLMLTWRRPTAFLVSAVALAATALVMLLFADRAGGAADVWKATALMFVGPLAVAAFILCVRWIRERRAAAIVAGILGYAAGVGVWIIIAVNIHAISP